MRTETSVKYVDRLKYLAGDTFSMARVYKLSHKRLCETLNKRVRQTSKYKRLPYWGKREVEGFIDACHSFHWRLVEWRVCLNGQYIDGGNVPHGMWSEVTEGAFFYPDSDVMFNPKGDWTS